MTINTDFGYPMTIPFERIQLSIGRALKEAEHLFDQREKNWSSGIDFERIKWLRRNTSTHQSSLNLLHKASAYVCVRGVLEGM